MILYIIEGIIMLLIGGAIARWGWPAVDDYLERIKRRIERLRKVVVIYDRHRHSKRRHCFWKDIRGTKEQEIRFRIHFRFVSIADELLKRRNPSCELFDRRQTDIIIVNWDTINGDPVYGSDRAQQFFEHHRPDMKAWMEDGGIIVVESQGASWGAIQRPYECFVKCFEGSQVTITEELLNIGEELLINDKYSNHPILRGFNKEDLVLRPGALCERKEWFPKGIARPTTAGYKEIFRHPRKGYRGWFEVYSSDWEPLILAKESKKPVFLCRAVIGEREVGACILTTMFIASSELTKLIRNLVDLPDQMAWRTRLT